MERYLMNFGSNWADEIDVDGVCVLTKKQMENFKECAKTATGEFCIGTNEEIDFDDERDILNSVGFDIITDEEYKILKKLNLTNLGFAKSFYEWVIDNA